MNTFDFAQQATSTSPSSGVLSIAAADNTSGPK